MISDSEDRYGELGVKFLELDNISEKVKNTSYGNCSQIELFRVLFDFSISSKH